MVLTPSLPPTQPNATQPLQSLRHCKWVDEVVEDAPWVVTEEFLRRHRIDYVCHDALPYADTSGQASDGDVYSHLKKHGRFLETQRTDGISTSDIINRVIVHYDDYVLRQLQRGYSAKEMNVPQWKGKCGRACLGVCWGLCGCAALGLVVTSRHATLGLLRVDNCMYAYCD